MITRVSLFESEMPTNRDRTTSNMLISVFRRQIRNYFLAVHIYTNANLSDEDDVDTHTHIVRPLVRPFV